MMSNERKPESPATVASDPENRFVIAAFLGTQTLGDFIIYQIAAASIARAVPGSRLVVIYRDDRPYKTFVNLCNPYVSTALKVPADSGTNIPLDWFDGMAGVPGRPFDDEWYEQGYHKPDLLLTPSMIDFNRCPGPLPKLRVPADMVPLLTEALTRRGVDRDQWFVCLHMREEGYRWRKDVDFDRCVDPKTYLPMIVGILREQGGQVVRVGDPSMTPLPEMDGFIDLSGDGGNFPEQAFAASRARYFIGTDTGTTQLAASFKTPAATTNAIGIGVWNDGDVVLIKKFIMSDGRVLRPRELLEMGSLSEHRLRPKHVKFVDNSPEQLIAVADHMFQMTSNCPGWREGSEEEPCTAPGSVTLPLQSRYIEEIADLTFWE